MSIYCGINWGNNGMARHEIIRNGEAVAIALEAGVPVPQGIDRWCTGYYDFRSDVTGEHILCPQSTLVTSGHQCRDCQYREGFIALHRAKTMHEVPPQLRDYISQEHILYLATFGLGVVKIGTAARSRHPARWYEQGALAAIELTTVRDGIEVRRLEQSLSRAHGLAQALRGATKTKLLAAPPTMDDLAGGLRAMVAQMADVGDIFHVNDVWHGTLAAVANRSGGGTGLSVVPAGSTEWDMNGTPDVIGQCLVWDGPTSSYLMDVKPLIGRQITFTTVGAGGTPQQIAMF